jgi:nucleoid DNA-binding protein/nucleoid-associated protein YgaU
MDAKLNHSEISALLAKECNISAAKAELFTKAFFDLIIEGLEQDGMVKVNGLGTFKITEVASRGSVNVNTGEKIEIKGHGKLTFIPAETLKEAVNQHFAMFEPVEVDENYQPEEVEDNENEETTVVEVEAEPAAPSVPVSEIEEEEPAMQVVEHRTFVEIEEEVPAMPVEEQHTKIEIEEEVPFVEEAHAAPVVSQPVVAEVEEPVAVEEPVVDVVEESPAVKEEDPVAAVVEEAPVAKVEESVAETVAPVVRNERPSEPVMVKVPLKKKPLVENTPKRKKSRWSVYLVAVMVVAVALILVNRMDVSDTVAVEDDKKTVQPAMTEQKTKDIVATVPVVKDTVAETKVVAEKEVVMVVAEPEKTAVDAVKVAKNRDGKYRFVMVDELAARDLRSITVADTTHYVFDGDLARHTLARKETLARIAYKYYGDKKLWPYIVKYNKIANPKGLKPGRRLRIPRLFPKE